MKAKRKALLKLIEKTNGSEFDVVVMRKSDFDVGINSVYTRTLKIDAAFFLPSKRSTTSHCEHICTVIDVKKERPLSLWLDGVLSFNCRGKTKTFDELPELVA